MKLVELKENVIDFAAKKAERDLGRQNWYAVVWKTTEETAADDPGLDDVGMAGPTNAPVGRYTLSNPGHYLDHAVSDEAHIVVARTQEQAVKQLQQDTHDWLDHDGQDDGIHYSDFTNEKEEIEFGTTFKQWTKA